MDDLPAIRESVKHQRKQTPEGGIRALNLPLAQDLRVSLPKRVDTIEVEGELTHQLRSRTVFHPRVTLPPDAKTRLSDLQYPDMKASTSPRFQS
jgi:hypothetical protein